MQVLSHESFWVYWVTFGRAFSVGSTMSVLWALECSNQWWIYDFHAVVHSCMISNWALLMYMYRLLKKYKCILPKASHVSSMLPVSSACTFDSICLAENEEITLVKNVVDIDCFLLCLLTGTQGERSNRTVNLNRCDKHLAFCHITSHCHSTTCHALCFPPAPLHWNTSKHIG